MSISTQIVNPGNPAEEGGQVMYSSATSSAKDLGLEARGWNQVFCLGFSLEFRVCKHSPA